MSRSILLRCWPAALGILAIALWAAAAALPGGARAADHDCPDFPTQAAAQAYYVGNGYGPGYDPERLDADHDAIACESNACPCAGASAPPAPPPPDVPPGVPPPAPPVGPPPATAPAKVVRATVRVLRVIDGDTLQVRTAAGTTPRVRLVGIDAPEVSATRYGAPDCGGTRAKSELVRLLPRRRVVHLVSDPTQDVIDGYGRLLRYVSRDGLDTGRRMIRAGWAEPYIFRVAFSRLATYTAAANAAKADGRGVWRACGGDFHSAAP